MNELKAPYCLQKCPYLDNKFCSHLARRDERQVSIRYRWDAHEEEAELPAGRDMRALNRSWDWSWEWGSVFTGQREKGKGRSVCDGQGAGISRGTGPRKILICLGSRGGVRVGEGSQGVLDWIRGVHGSWILKASVCWAGESEHILLVMTTSQQIV